MVKSLRSLNISFNNIYKLKILFTFCFTCILALRHIKLEKLISLHCVITTTVPATIQAHNHNNYTPNWVCLWSLFGQSRLRCPLSNTVYPIQLPCCPISSQFLHGPTIPTNVCTLQSQVSLKLTQSTPKRRTHINMCICYYGWLKTISSNLQQCSYSLHLTTEDLSAQPHGSEL